MENGHVKYGSLKVRHHEKELKQVCFKTKKKNIVSKKQLCFVSLWYQFSIQVITREKLWVQRWFDLTTWAEYKTSTGQKLWLLIPRFRVIGETLSRSYSSLDPQHSIWPLTVYQPHQESVLKGWQRQCPTSTSMYLLRDAAVWVLLRRHIHIELSLCWILLFLSLYTVLVWLPNNLSSADAEATLPLE